MLGHTSGRGGIGGAGIGAGKGGVGRGGIGDQNNRGRGFGMTEPYGDRAQTGGYRISGYGGYGYNGGYGGGYGDQNRGNWGGKEGGSRGTPRQFAQTPRNRITIGPTIN